MGWVQFVIAYTATLVNTWLLVAGAILTLNELFAIFIGRSFEWPRQHRGIVILLILVVAQTSAYKELLDTSASESKGLREELTKREPVIAENPDHTRLTTDLNEARKGYQDLQEKFVARNAELITARSALTATQSQVIDLQQQLARSKQSPTVVLGSGATLNRDTCDAIGKYAEEGRQIVGETRKQLTPHPGPKADAWAANVEAFLRRVFGDGSVGLFRNASGLPMGFTSLDSEIHRNIEGYMQVRLARLQEFGQKCF